MWHMHLGATLSVCGCARVWQYLLQDACACAFVRARACVCVCVYLHMYMRAYVYVSTPHSLMSHLYFMRDSLYHNNALISDVISIVLNHFNLFMRFDVEGTLTEVCLRKEWCKARHEAWYVKWQILQRDMTRLMSLGFVLNSKHAKNGTKNWFWLTLLLLLHQK